MEIKDKMGTHIKVEGHENHSMSIEFDDGVNYMIVEVDIDEMNRAVQHCHDESLKLKNEHN